MTTFKPMLAVNSKPTDLIKPQLGSIKLEGVRGIVLPGEGLVGRSLKPINNSLIYQHPTIVALEEYCSENNIVIEGEFYVHGWTFNRIDSCLRGEGNIDALQLELHVFDCYAFDAPDAIFEKRIEFYNYAVKNLQALGVDKIFPVVQTLMSDADEIRNAYLWAIENGYEGFCLKAAELEYKLGRSTLKQEYFTRIKPEETYDCVVLEFLERFENLCDSEINELGYQYKRQDKDQKRGTGMVQSALVYCPQVKAVHKVSMTRGLTDPDRMRLWENKGAYVGKCMQYVGVPVPGQNIPRSPRFDKWRLDIDVNFLQHDPSDSVFVSWDVEEIQKALEVGCDLITFEQFNSLLENGWCISVENNTSI